MNAVTIFFFLVAITMVVATEMAHGPEQGPNKGEPIEGAREGKYWRGYGGYGGYGGYYGGYRSYGYPSYGYGYRSSYYPYYNNYYPSYWYGGYGK